MLNLEPCRLRWLAAKLDTLSDPDQVKMVDRFARWHVGRQLRERVTTGPMSDCALLNVKQTTTVTIGLRDWHAARGADLEDLSPRPRCLARGRAIDPRTRRPLRVLGPHTALMPPRPQRPNPRTTQTRPTGTTTRLALLRRAMAKPDLATITVRVAAALVLLYGVTARQLAALTLDDLTHASKQTFLQLGHHPVPLPDPLVELIDDPRYRRNTISATSR